MDVAMRYTVTYERDETGWWFASVSKLRGCHTQGRTITQARGRIREALAAVLDDDEAAASAELVDDVRIPVPARKSLERALAARAQAEEEQAKAASATAAAVRALVERLGLSVRDAAELLGVSHQRVHQLAHGTR
jgi:predicted RNase H-like HicB family nuclease